MDRESKYPWTVSPLKTLSTGLSRESPHQHLLWLFYNYGLPKLSLTEPHAPCLVIATHWSSPLWVPSEQGLVTFSLVTNAKRLAGGHAVLHLHLSAAESADPEEGAQGLPAVLPMWLPGDHPEGTLSCPALRRWSQWRRQQRDSSEEETDGVSRSIYHGHHRVNLDCMFVGIQRSNKMLYLREFGQHNTIMILNLENNYFLNPRRKNFKKYSFLLLCKSNINFVSHIARAALQMGNKEGI